jgi:putative solute:sodium symporter small subunit
MPDPPEDEKTESQLGSAMATEAQRRHWEKTRSLTFVILAIWAVCSIVAPWFARELDAVTFLGFEFGYYMVVQGSLIIFILLIVIQNWRQDAIDDEFGGTGE